MQTWHCRRRLCDRGYPRRKQTNRPIHEGLVSAGFPAEHLHVVETLAEAIAWYQRNLSSGDSVLFLNDLPDTYSA